MTTDELKKEAEEYATKRASKFYTRNMWDRYYQTYIDSAEPREMRIAELEQENALLKGRNEGFEQQIMGLLIKYEEVYKRFPDLKSAMDKAKEVLKENAELKEKLKPENCLKSLAKSGFVKFTCENGNEHDQLTKAKNLLQKVADVCGYPNYDIPIELYADIANYLKDSEVEK
jgi:hypothetical protein